MIVSRDRPVEEVQRDLTQQALAQMEGDDPVPAGITRYGRRTTEQTPVLVGPSDTLASKILADGTGRKERLVKTLDGDPNKGTVIVAIRGSADTTDFALDASAFSTSTRNRLRASGVYKEIKNHIQENLRLLFSVPPSSYKANWDVFATGHSLGGAITDQLILDGVVKGGVSYSAPRTVDSKSTRPSYALINSQDGVIGKAIGQKDSPYDVVVEGQAAWLNPAANHSITYLNPSVTATNDKYSMYNNELFSPTKVSKFSFNLMTGKGDPDDGGDSEMEGSGRAPILRSFYEAAKNAYDHGDQTFRQTQKNFMDEGLLLPDLTLYRSNKAIVQFYVYATPKFNYNEMPIRPIIEQTLRQVITIGSIDDAKLAMILNNF